MAPPALEGRPPPRQPAPVASAAPIDLAAPEAPPLARSLQFRSRFAGDRGDRPQTDSAPEPPHQGTGADPPFKPYARIWPENLHKTSTFSSGTNLHAAPNVFRRSNYQENSQANRIDPENDAAGQGIDSCFPVGMHEQRSSNYLPYNASVRYNSGSDVPYRHGSQFMGHFQRDNARGDVPARPTYASALPEHAFHVANSGSVRRTLFQDLRPLQEGNVALFDNQDAAGRTCFPSYVPRHPMGNTTQRPHAQDLQDREPQPYNSIGQHRPSSNYRAPLMNDNNRRDWCNHRGNDGIFHQRIGCQNSLDTTELSPIQNSNPHCQELNLSFNLPASSSLCVQTIAPGSSTVLDEGSEDVGIHVGSRRNESFVGVPGSHLNYAGSNQAPGGFSQGRVFESSRQTARPYHGASNPVQANAPNGHPLLDGRLQYSRDNRQPSPPPAHGWPRNDHDNNWRQRVFPLNQPYEERPRAFHANGIPASETTVNASRPPPMNVQDRAYQGVRLHGARQQPFSEDNSRSDTLVFCKDTKKEPCSPSRLAARFPQAFYQVTADSYVVDNCRKIENDTKEKRLYPLSNHRDIESTANDEHTTNHSSFRGVRQFDNRKTFVKETRGSENRPLDLNDRQVFQTPSNNQADSDEESIQFLCEIVNSHKNRKILKQNSTEFDPSRPVKEEPPDPADDFDPPNGLPSNINDESDDSPEDEANNELEESNGNVIVPVKTLQRRLPKCFVMLGKIQNDLPQPNAEAGGSGSNQVSIITRQQNNSSGSSADSRRNARNLRRSEQNSRSENLTSSSDASAQNGPFPSGANDSAGEGHEDEEASNVPSQETIGKEKTADRLATEVEKAAESTEIAPAAAPEDLSTFAKAAVDDAASTAIEGDAPAMTNAAAAVPAAPPSPVPAPALAPTPAPAPANQKRKRDVHVGPTARRTLQATVAAPATAASDTQGCPPPRVLPRRPSPASPSLTLPREEYCKMTLCLASIWEVPATRDYFFTRLNQVSSKGAANLLDVAQKLRTGRYAAVHQFVNDVRRVLAANEEGAAAGAFQVWPSAETVRCAKEKFEAILAMTYSNYDFTFLESNDKDDGAFFTESPKKNQKLIFRHEFLERICENLSLPALPQVEHRNLTAKKDYTNSSCRGGSWRGPIGSASNAESTPPTNAGGNTSKSAVREAGSMPPQPPAHWQPHRNPDVAAHSLVQVARASRAPTKTQRKIV